MIEAVETKSQDAPSLRSTRKRFLFAALLTGVGSYWAWDSSLSLSSNDPIDVQITKLGKEKGELRRNLAETDAIIQRSILNSEFVDPADPRRKQLNVLDQQMNRLIEEKLHREPEPIPTARRAFFLTGPIFIIGFLAMAFRDRRI